MRSTAYESSLWTKVICVPWRWYMEEIPLWCEISLIHPVNYGQMQGLFLNVLFKESYFKLRFVYNIIRHLCTLYFYQYFWLQSSLQNKYVNWIEPWVKNSRIKNKQTNHQGINADPQIEFISDDFMKIFLYFFNFYHMEWKSTIKWALAKGEFRGDNN